MLYRLFQAQVQGVGDNGMPYGHFIEVWYFFVEISEVGEVQIVAGIDAETAVVGRLARFHIWFPQE